MRRWILSALISASLALPAYGFQDAAKDKPKTKEKQDAKQTEQAVKDARKHAKKADEQPYDAMQKADSEGKKDRAEAKKPGAVGTSGVDARFRGLDKNANGRIERAEWNGDDRSFAAHDRNGDGVLSGDEVKPAAKRPRAQ